MMACVDSTPSSNRVKKQEQHDDMSVSVSTDSGSGAAAERYTCPVREPMIKPLYWYGRHPVDADKFKIDCSGIDMTADEMNPEVVNKMKELFEQTGLVLLTNTGMTELDKMQKWVEVILPDTMTYNGGANSRGSIGDNIYETGAPGNGHLQYHHEMVYVSKSVSALGFCCKACPSGKGHTYVSENVGVTDAILKTPFGQKLKEKGVCYIRCLTDRYADCFKDKPKGWNGVDETGVYNHWQRSFGTDDPEEAERKANERSLKVEWGPERYMKTKYYASAFEYCPFTKRNLLYTSVADDSIWFDTWPGVKDLPTMKSFSTASMRERPLKMTFGDDTDFTREELIEFLGIYDKFGMPIEWKQGDIAIVCNYRWAHGRPEYSLEEGEQRTLGVVLGPEFDRLGAVGEW